MKKNSARFISMRIKIILVLALSLLVAWGIYAGIQQIGYYYVDEFYLSQQAQNERLDYYAENLQEFVTDHQLATDQFNQLLEWNNDYNVSIMMQSPSQDVIYEGDWWDVDGYTTEEILDENGGRSSMMASESSRAWLEDEGTFSIEFTNETAYVSMIDYSDLMLLYVIDDTALIIAVVIFALIIILFNHRTTWKIIQLGKEVREIESGNLQKEITVYGRDELATLATDVNNMRKSIVTRLEKEQEAWQANCELITSMSHDIRTPLTVLIGYLDIIESEKYQTKEQFTRYVVNSKEKALQLKELSDKLFQYFVVYSNQNNPFDLVKMEAQSLATQVLGEQVLYLQSEGFEVQFSENLDSEEIEVDVAGIQRVFDNCLSNIRKYGDKKVPIEISANHIDGCVAIQFVNQIKPMVNPVESTKIGLKSCQKLMEHMGGEFRYLQEGNTFCVDIQLVVCQ